MITCKSLNTGGLGRFGNQMFSLASTIGIAIKNNQPYAFDEWINRDNALFGGPEDRMSDYFVNPLPQLPEGLHFTDIPYHWEYRDYYIPDGNWNICSHLQDPRYFSHCMSLIREIFRMKDEPEQNDLVCLHWRAGDYLPDPAAYHPRCDMDYYERAMQQFADDQKFCVFSDDINGARDMLSSRVGSNQTLMFSMDGSYLQDFALMKKCKSFIIANSSYSLMAAILGEHPGKKIIAPRRWFGASAGLVFDGYPENSTLL